MDLATASERHKVPFTEILKAAREEKEKGKALNWVNIFIKVSFYKGTDRFHQGSLYLAKQRYRKALRLIREAIPTTDTEENDMLDLTVKLLRNVAQVSIKQKRYRESCGFLDDALQLRPDDPGALRKKLEAVISLGEYGRGQELLQRCRKVTTSEIDLKKVDILANRLLQEKTRDKHRQGILNKAMAQALMGGKKETVKKEVTTAEIPLNEEVQVSEDFRTTIDGELQKLKVKNDPNVTFSCPLEQLEHEEVAYIKQQALKNDLLFSVFEATPGNKVLTVQRKGI